MRVGCRLAHTFPVTDSPPRRTSERASEGPIQSHNAIYVTVVQLLCCRGPARKGLWLWLVIYACGAGPRTPRKECARLTKLRPTMLPSSVQLFPHEKGILHGGGAAASSKFVLNKAPPRSSPPLLILPSSRLGAQRIF